MRRNNHKLRFENLEARNLMAGDVSVGLGADSRDLSIVGDDLSNGIEIEQIGIDMIRVTGTNRHGAPTTINGSNQPVTLRVTDDIRISMLGGGDLVEMQDVNLRQRTHNDLQIDMGSGSFDDVRLRNVRVSDDIEIDLGSGTDFADLSNVRADDNLHVDGGQGNDTMLIRSSRAEDIRVFGGSGADEAHLTDNTVSDELFAELGSGSDELVLYGNRARRTTFDGGTGTDRLYTLPNRANDFWVSTWWNSTGFEIGDNYRIPGHFGYDNAVGSNV